MRVTTVLCTLGLAITASASNAEAGLGDLAQRDLGRATEQHHARSNRRRHRKRHCKAKVNLQQQQQQQQAPAAVADQNQAAAVSSWTPQVNALAAPAPTTAQTTWSQTVAPAAAVTWQPTTSETTAAVQPTSGNSNSNTGVTSSVLSAAGISGFMGNNVGIGSWFRTHSSQDSTNGRSWCDLAYQDDWLGFAPDVSVMLNNFGGNRDAAGPAYCGLEALATNPANGKTALIYIVDGFDPAWVRVPGSIDLTMGAFNALYGSDTNDKNVVIQNLQWTLTGNRLDKYKYGANRNW